MNIGPVKCEIWYDTAKNTQTQILMEISKVFEPYQYQKKGKALKINKQTHMSENFQNYLLNSIYLSHYKL